MQTTSLKVPLRPSTPFGDWCAQSLKQLKKLSSALIQLEDWGNARSVLESALKQAPDDASLYSNLGVVYQAQGEKELARQMFEKAIQLRPDWQTPQDNLLKLTEE